MLVSRGSRVHCAAQVLVNSLMLLEVLDFPPLLGVLDAHALWHAATAPLAYLFYGFIQGDVLDAIRV